MRLSQAGALAVVLPLLSPHLAGAACRSTRCPDRAAIEAVRAQVAMECDCAGVTSHAGYVTCAKRLIKGAVRDHRLSPKCKRMVQRCEARTTCGMGDAVACCEVTPKGKVKARIMRDAGRCRSTVCAGVRSAADACTSTGACAQRAFRSIQAVFSGSCALPSCHSAIARKGELVLESDGVSYRNLVEQPAVQPDARTKGLMRVKSGDPENSFLVRKLRGLGPGDSMPQGGGKLPDDIIAMIEDWIARGAHETAEECPALAGSEPTPLHAGAVQTLCDDTPIDTGNFVWKPEPPLEVPERGKGLQLYTPPRDIEPGTEWETCYAFRPPWEQIAADVGLPGTCSGGGNPGAKCQSDGDCTAGGTCGNRPPPFLKQQVYRMHEGSHHMLLYAYFGAHPEVWPLGKYFPCFAADCLNPGDCPPDSEVRIPIGGTQVAGTRYVVSYPEGIGLPILGKNTVLIVNLHYTNPFRPRQKIYGEAWLNLYFQEPGAFKALLDGVFAINSRDLIVEPYATRTISRIWQPHGILTRQPTDAAVFQLFGHMHKRGTLFQIEYVRGGKCSGRDRVCGRDDDCACRPWEQNCQPDQTCERQPDAEDVTIYHSTEWDNQPIMEFAKPYLLVNRDEGLRWTCTHTNGYPGDPDRPPKKCHEGCKSCGWDAATRTCVFTRGVDLGVDREPRVFQEGEPIPLVFGELADDDMCNMFGYFVHQDDLPKLE